MILHQPPVYNPVQRELDRQPVGSVWWGELTLNGKIKPAPKGWLNTFAVTVQLWNVSPTTPGSSGNGRAKTALENFPQRSSRWQSTTL